MNSPQILTASLCYKDNIQYAFDVLACQVRWLLMVNVFGRHPEASEKAGTPEILILTSHSLPVMFELSIVFRVHGSLFSFSAKVNLSGRLDSPSLLVCVDYMTFLCSSHCRQGQHPWSQMAETLIKYVPSLSCRAAWRGLPLCDQTECERWTPVQTCIA